MNEEQLQYVDQRIKALVKKHGPRALAALAVFELATFGARALVDKYPERAESILRDMGISLAELTVYDKPFMPDAWVEIADAYTGLQDGALMLSDGEPTATGLPDNLRPKSAANE